MLTIAENSPFVLDGVNFLYDLYEVSFGTYVMTVWTENNDHIVATANIDPHSEHISVDYCVGGDNSTYPFHEWENNAERNEELAKWLVATHPNNG